MASSLPASEHGHSASVLGWHLLPRLSEKGALHHTFPVPVAASHCSCSCHCTQAHLSSATVPKVHQQTKKCSGCRVDTDSQSWKRRSTCVWEAVDGKMPSVFRLRRWDGPSRMLSEGRGTLGMVPGCGEAVGASDAGRRL